MFRSLSVIQALLAMSFIGVCAPSVSKASPSDGAAAGSCSFVLTPPKVVQVSDTSMVLATVKPGPCTRDAIPNRSTVCLSIAGTSAPAACGDKVGPEPALVYYPYRAGATYVVTGKGCVDSFEQPITTRICQDIGPTSFTL